MSLVWYMLVQDHVCYAVLVCYDCFDWLLCPLQIDLLLHYALCCHNSHAVCCLGILGVECALCAWTVVCFTIYTVHVVSILYVELLMCARACVQPKACSVYVCFEWYIVCCYAREQSGCLLKISCVYTVLFDHLPSILLAIRGLQVIMATTPFTYTTYWFGFLCLSYTTSLRICILITQMGLQG